MRRPHPTPSRAPTCATFLYVGSPRGGSPVSAAACQLSALKEAPQSRMPTKGWGAAAHRGRGRVGGWACLGKVHTWFRLQGVAAKL